MRCPKCQAVVSELRDVCPKCNTDLRPIKRTLGLRVEEPDTSYEALVAKNQPQEKGVFARLGTMLGGESSEPASEPELTHRPTLTPVPMDSDLSSMFDEAMTKLAAENSSNGFELGLEQFEKIALGEDVKILFDSSFDSLDDPELGKKYHQVLSSHSRQIDAGHLTEVMAKVEKTLEAPLMGLKSTKDERRKTELRAIIKEGSETLRSARVNKAIPARPSARILAFVVDGLIILMMAIALSLLWAGIKGQSVSDDYNLIPLMARILNLSLVLLVLYPLIAMRSRPRTPGMKFANIRLSNELGEKPSDMQVVIRSLCTPLSAFIFGYLPIFSRKPTLQDRVARTLVVRR